MTDNNQVNKLVVIGSPVLDQIKRFDGKEVFSWGGITYSLFTFIQLALRDKSLRIQLFPIFKLGKDEFSTSLASTLEKFEFVNLQYISANGILHRNYLVYSDEQNRDEYFSPGNSALKINDLLPLLDANAFFINYIYPEDLPLKALRSLSSASSGWIFLDVHSLVRKVDSKSGKFHLADFGRWQSIVPLVDVIQMNVSELQAFTGLELKNDMDIILLIQRFLLLGPKVVIITNGGEPGFIGYKIKGKQLIHQFFPEFVKPIDPTGCGDVFGAAFFFFYIKTEDPRNSLDEALKIAKLHALRKWIPQETLDINVEQHKKDSHHQPHSPDTYLSNASPAQSSFLKRNAVNKNRFRS